MNSHCIFGSLLQLVFVQLSCSGIVFLVCICGVAIVLSEELRRISIATQLHLPKLLPGPIGVQICRSDKSQVHTKVPMHSWTINANEHSICYWGPCWILSVAIEALLENWESKVNCFHLECLLTHFICCLGAQAMEHWFDFLFSWSRWHLLLELIAEN